MHKAKWNEQQKANAHIHFSIFKQSEKAYDIYLELVIYNRKTKPSEAMLKLTRKYNKVAAFVEDR